jgi:hypothetical protein
MDAITVSYSRRVELAPGEPRVLEATLTLSSTDEEGLRGVLDNVLSAVDGAIEKAVSAPPR